MASKKAADAVSPTPVAADGPAQTDTIFVYLCCGVVESISPATSVQALPDQIVVRNGDQAVACFRRSDVFYCSRVQTPPVLS